MVAPALVALCLPHSRGSGVGWVWVLWVCWWRVLHVLERPFHLSFQISYDREYLRILCILYEIYLGLF